MRLFWLLATLIVVLVPGAGRAQPTPVVVEMFTSQGCTSCPPADALLSELATQPGVIALALHVDYWDYLGWEDSFGSPAFSARQKAYALVFGKRSIFTPQAVVQGREPMVGHDAEHIRSRIAAHQDEVAPVELTLDADADVLSIGLAPRGAPVGQVDVFLVLFTPSAEVSIEAGENAGERILYTNIVTSWDAVASWDGVEPVEIAIEIDGLNEADGAVIVQRGRVGPVMSAALLP